MITSAINQPDAAELDWDTHIRVDQAASVPLFLQVKNALGKWIESGLRDGTLSPGDRVPSERDLSLKFRVSGITAKRALNELQREGLITRRQGRGSFIARPRKLVMGLERLYSLTSAALERGMTPSRRCLEASEIEATENIAQQLQLTPGDPVAKIVRLRLVDDVPLAVDTSYVSLLRFPGILEYDLDHNSLYYLMKNEYRLEPLRAREYLEPTLVNAFEAALLGIPDGAPAMLIARIAYGPNDVSLEYNKSIIRGDMCRFYIDMLKDNL